MQDILMCVGSCPTGWKTLVVLMNWQECPIRNNLCCFGGHQILLDTLLYMDSRDAVETVTPSWGQECGTTLLLISFLPPHPK